MDWLILILLIVLVAGLFGWAARWVATLSFGSPGGQPAFPIGNILAVILIIFGLIVCLRMLGVIGGPVYMPWRGHAI